MHIKALKSNILEEACDHFGGSNTDNANDETTTNTRKIKQMKNHNDPEHDVKPKQVCHGSSYHIDNMGMVEASISMVGKIERNNHYQCHHQQIIQSVRDLYNLDKMIKQGFFDKFLQDNGHKPRKVKQHMQGCSIGLQINI